MRHAAKHGHGGALLRTGVPVSTNGKEPVGRGLGQRKTVVFCNTIKEGERCSIFLFACLCCYNNNQASAGGRGRGYGQTVGTLKNHVTCTQHTPHYPIKLRCRYPVPVRSVVHGPLRALDTNSPKISHGFVQEFMTSKGMGVPVPTFASSDALTVSQDGRSSSSSSAKLFLTPFLRSVPSRLSGCDMLLVVETLIARSAPFAIDFLKLRTLR